MDTDFTTSASFPAYQVLSVFIDIHVNVQFILISQIDMASDS